MHIKGIKPVTGALMMFDRGFKVFPLRPNDKRPAVDAWQEWAEKATRKHIEDYGTANPTYNWGVHCSGHTVLDVDNGVKEGVQKVGSSSLAALGHKLPATLTIKTPSGGFHHYFAGGSIRNSVSILGKDLDTRTHGGYVVCPESAIEGVIYTIVNNTDTLPPVPTWMAEKLLEAHKEKKTLSDDAPVLQGERNVTLASIAGTMRSRGLGYEAIIAALQVVNETQLASPLPDAEVEQIARSVARYEPQIAQTAADFVTDKVEQTSPTNPIAVSDFQGLPPKRSWLVKEWIPEREVSSLYGSGGTGKSLLALQLAVCAASGKPWLGLPIEKQVPVLAVFCEDTKDELHRRVYDITKAPEYDFVQQNKDKVCLLWPRVGLMNDIARENDKKTDIIKGLFRKELEDALQKMPTGPKLLILDTLSDVYLGDENVREKVNKFVKTHLGSLVQEYGCTLLVLAHPSRSGQNTGDLLSGSTAWENAVRNRLALVPYDKKVNTGLMALTRMKSNYAKRGEAIIVRWDAGRYVVASKSEMSRAALSLSSQAVMDFIAKNLDKGGASLNDMAQKIVDCGTISGALETIKKRIKEALVEPVEIDNWCYSLDNSAVSGKGNSMWKISKNFIGKSSALEADFLA
jgi:RecA-family ATPase